MKRISLFFVLAFSMLLSATSHAALSSGRYVIVSKLNCNAWMSPTSARPMVRM
jgi:hypothetical protein